MGGHEYQCPGHELHTVPVSSGAQARKILKNLKDMQLVSEERTLNRRIAICEAAGSLKDLDISAMKAEVLAQSIELLKSVDPLPVPQDIQARLLERKLSDQLIKFGSATDPVEWKDIAAGIAFSAIPFPEYDPPAFQLDAVCACTLFTEQQKHFEEQMGSLNPDKSSDSVKMQSLQIAFDRQMQDSLGQPGQPGTWAGSSARHGH